VQQTHPFPAAERPDSGVPFLVPFRIRRLYEVCGERRTITDLDGFPIAQFELGRIGFAGTLDSSCFVIDGIAFDLDKLGNQQSREPVGVLSSKKVPDNLLVSNWIGPGLCRLRSGTGLE
jgi:hypothetical protein